MHTISLSSKFLLDTLSSVACAIHSTHHSILKASPVQLVFKVDMLSNIKNSLRGDHEYQIGDKVLVTDDKIHIKLICPTKGPYNIMQNTYKNGMFRIQKGAVTERFKN